MLRLLRRNPLSISVVNQAFLIPLRLPQNEISKPAGPAPYIISYLSTAVSTSYLKPSDKPDSTPSLLKRYGFSETQIKGIVQKERWLAAANAEKTIKPKLDFFLAFGYSPDELVNLVCSIPHVLNRSLEDRIAPSLNHLEAMLGSKELVKKAIRRQDRLLNGNFEKTLMPNINTLKEYRVPLRNIFQALAMYPRTLTVNPVSFTEAAKKVLEMGINTMSTSFIIGIQVMSWLSEANWKRKLELYQSFGWTEKDTLLAFAKNPLCMSKSEDKIKKIMEFFVEMLGVDPSFLVVHPSFLGYSLEKRIIPRCAVINVLVSKGLLAKIPSWSTLFQISEKKFKAEFVDNYKKVLPQVLDAFHGKVEFIGIDFIEKKKKKTNRIQD